LAVVATLFVIILYHFWENLSSILKHFFEKFLFFSNIFSSNRRAAAACATPQNKIPAVEGNLPQGLGGSRQPQSRVHLYPPIGQKFFNYQHTIHAGYLHTYNSVPHERFFLLTTAKSH
jgi:hypothetical protein